MYLELQTNMKLFCNQAMYAKVYTRTRTRTHAHPPFSFHRPCHPGARLPPGSRAYGTPSLTTAFSFADESSFSSEQSEKIRDPVSDHGILFRG